MIHGAEELDAAFAAMETNKPDAINVQGSLPIKHIAELTLKYRIPAISSFRPFAENGGLMSFWFDEAAVYHQTAVFVEHFEKRQAR